MLFRFWSFLLKLIMAIKVLPSRRPPPRPKKIRVLFVLKRHLYGPSLGLFNSCTFISKALESKGVDAKVVEVQDNNHIDREVARYRPTHVIIEALWVVPEKFPQLIKLHPKVRWVVRVHSNAPFLSGEGMALEWLIRYRELALKYDGQFIVSCNNWRMTDELNFSLGLKSVLLPNIYEPSLSGHAAKPRAWNPSCGKVVIGCFGAIRPLKNQLEQALAAVIFANEGKLELTFHINIGRIEENSNSVRRNLVALFDGTPHRLVQHGWATHDRFIRLVKACDLGLQASFSETFNIVAGDFVFSGVPLVGSGEIEWLATASKAEPTVYTDLVKKISANLKHPSHVETSQKNLKIYSAKALAEWVRWLGV
jgi:hypothetical protein